MLKENRSRKRDRQWGQSLTEVAIFVPIFLIIIAGVVEISSLVIQQSRVDTAVRTATRFGGQGGIDQGMRLSLLNSVSQTLSLDEERWDVWVIRGRVNISGNDYISDTWEFNHVYGLNQTQAFPDVDESELQNEVLRSLQQDASNQQAAGGIAFVGMLAYYDVATILGIADFIGPFDTVRSLGVMRASDVAIAVQTNGCAVFPIGIEIGLRSIDTFPAGTDFEYPSGVDAPEQGDFFFELPPSRSMLQASAGYLYRAVLNDDLDPDPATFDFLRWDWYGPASWGDALETSLMWPGNSKAACEDPAAGDPGWEHPVLRCSNDNQLQREEPIRVSQAAVVALPGVKAQLDEHIDEGRALRVPLWDISDPPSAIDGSGGGGVAFAPNEQRRVADFAVIRPVGYNLRSGEENWLLFQFVRLDRSCGQRAD